MSEVNERTQRTSLLRGPVEDIPGLTTYLATNFLPIAGGTMAGDLDMDFSNILNAGSIEIAGFPVATIQYVQDQGYATIPYVDQGLFYYLGLANNFSANASNLASGTVSDARLSANVARLNSANTGASIATTTFIVQAIASQTSPIQEWKRSDGVVGARVDTFGKADIYSARFHAGTGVGAAWVSICDPTLAIALYNAGSINWSSNGAATGTADVKILRNATGPTLETRAAGGLKVANADGSAVAAVEASKLTLNAGTKAAVAIQLGTGGPGYGIYSSNVGSTPGFGFAIGGTSFIYTSDVGQGFNIHSGFAYGWGSAAADTAMDTRFTRHSAGVVDLGTTSDNALGSLNLANLTASGNVEGTFRPTQFTVATLPSAAANTGRTVQVTDSSVDFPGNIGNTVAGGGANNVDVKSNGTNWRITG